MRRKVLWSVGLVITAAIALPALAQSSSSVSSGYLVTRDCQEEQAFVDGSATAVAAQLPSKYTATQDPATGAPILFVRAEQCRGVTLGNATGPATMASFGVLVHSPDGTGCASGVPGIGATVGDTPPACNWYTLGWLSTSSQVVQWFNSRAPGFPALYAPSLAFHLGTLDPASGGAPFDFSAPSSTGSPFAMSAVTRQHPGELAVRGGYWHETSPGTVKVVFASNDLTSGDANGTVSAPAGSLLAKLFGATSRPYLPVYSEIAAEHWDLGIYRLQQLWPGADEQSFGGTCSLQGTVTFTPPATNNAGALHYDYAASGTCSGTLDGQSVTGVPVRLRQFGNSYGSCSGAQTAGPGEGRLDFGAGRVLTYTLDFESTLTEVNFSLYGDRSGMTAGHGSFLTQRTSPDVVTQCAGSGAHYVPLDLSLQTETPMVSATTNTHAAAAHRLVSARVTGELPRTGMSDSALFVFVVVPLAAALVTRSR